MNQAKFSLFCLMFVLVAILASAGAGRKTHLAAAAERAVHAGEFMASPPLVAGPTITRISLTSNGGEGNGPSTEPSLSADGRYVAFVSRAGNLVPGDTNGWYDIFVHDRETGQTSRVSVASNGMEANEASHSPSISADGRYVAFSSDASNLVAGDTEDYHTHVFVHDRETGQTSRVSVTSAGVRGNAWSYSPSISADGRFVAFVSQANNFVADDTNDCPFYYVSCPDIYVHDRQTGLTTRISVASDGAQSNHVSWGPSISDDNRYVAFSSLASNLVPDDTNETEDIFVHDRQTGQTNRISVTSDGVQANRHSSGASISAGGRYVAFVSAASNLVAGDTHLCQHEGSGQQNCYDIFVHDREMKETTRISVSSEGTEGNADARFETPSLSAHGRYVAFASEASNLVPNDTNEVADIFIHDRQTGQTRRVAATPEHDYESGGLGHRVSLSASGRYLAFGSGANDLVSHDNNGMPDIFVQDRRMLAINYGTGAPGSIFALNGAFYPAIALMPVHVNGRLLGQVLASSAGDVAFLLDTTKATEGIYLVTVNADASTVVSFVLDDGQPLRPQEGEGTSIAVPEGIALTEQYFMPLTFNAADGGQP